MGLRFVKSSEKIRKKGCQPGQEVLLVVPAGLRSRIQSLFHGNPAALEFTSFPGTGPRRYLYLPKMGFPDLGLEMRV